MYRGCIADNRIVKLLGARPISQQEIVFTIFVLIFLGFALFLPGFRTPANMLGLLQSVAILGVLGLMRVMLWPVGRDAYGGHIELLAFTVAFAVLGIVMWGALCGAMLPFLLRRLGLDPASASAPFVATLVDVTGIVLYFTIASLFLTGTLL